MGGVNRIRLCVVVMVKHTAMLVSLDVQGKGFTWTLHFIFFIFRFLLTF